MKIYYKGIEQMSICLAEEVNIDNIGEIIYNEIEFLTKENPDDYKDRYFNVYLDEQETKAIFKKPVSLRMKKNVVASENNPTAFSYTLSTYYYCFPRNVFYGGDLWVI